MARCTEWWELSNGLYGAKLKKGVAEQTALTKLAAYEDRAEEPRDVDVLAEENERLRKRCSAAEHDIALVMKGMCVCHICVDGDCTKQYANPPDCEPKWRGSLPRTAGEGDAK